MLRNSENHFGWVAILVHWLMAIAVVGLFALGWYMVELTYYDALYQTLPHIHKSVGILLVFVYLFRVTWNRLNPKPRLLSELRWQRIAAGAAHAGMNLLIALILFSGYLIPTAEGSPVAVFGWFELPALVTSIPDQEDLAGLVHEYLAYLLMLVVLVHALAALKHHFINRDHSLRRMLGLLDTPRNHPETLQRHKGVET